MEMEAVRGWNTSLGRRAREVRVGPINMCLCNGQHMGTGENKVGVGQHAKDGKADLVS